MHPTRTQRGKLSRRVKFGFGVGHIFNDLCASMWFTYLLLYLQFVLELDNAIAGALLMTGQIADAIATPFVGIQSDKGCKSLCINYGRRKTWHLVGTLCVILSFPFVFIKCTNCFLNYPNSYVVFLGIMICVFQFGWASCQVSHLALIPDLTSNEYERDELNLIRFFFDISSDVFVYVVVWVIFANTGAPPGGRAKFIDPTDSYKFQIVTIIVVITGFIFSCVFHILTPEEATCWRPDINDHSTNELEDSSDLVDSDERVPRVKMTWKDWLTESQFYQMSVIYSCARLVANLANIYMPIYLQASLKVDEKLTALVPLVMSISGMGSTIIIRLTRKCVGKKMTMVVAILLGMIACTLSSVERLSEAEIYILGILWGTTGAIMVVLALTFTSDLIGECTESSAFVYGSMSCGDKLINGLAVFVIQELTVIECVNGDCSTYYRDIMSIGILGPLLVAMMGVISLSCIKLGRTKKIRNAMSDASGSSSNSSDSGLLIPSDIKMGYGSVTKV